jgi:positive regulator of sigma E activity
MTIQARVRRIDSCNTVELELSEAIRCSGCRGGCFWRRTFPTALRVRVDARLGVGELVSVSLPARSVLRAALILHGLPWAGILAGAAAAASLGGSSDLSCLLGAVIGGLGALAVARGMRERLESLTLARLTVSPQP